MLEVIERGSITDTRKPWCFFRDGYTARPRRTRPMRQFFPGMGDDRMLEPGWELVADRIEDWLSARAL